MEQEGQKNSGCNADKAEDQATEAEIVILTELDSTSDVSKTSASPLDLASVGLRVSGFHYESSNKMLDCLLRPR